MSQPVRSTALRLGAASLLWLVLACNLPVGRTAPAPTGAPALPTSAALSTPEPTLTRAAPPSPGAAEAILILQPGPGSRLTSPLQVTGEANSTFEQTLGVRLVLEDGTELAAGPAMIDAELGQRGPFESQLTFSVSSERNALLQVYASSPRDGGITHLASVGVTLAPGGPAEIRTAAPRPEAIHISQPLPGADISGGLVLVEGIGLASFEGTLIVEVYDLEGRLIGSEPLIVEAPDLGLPGSFSVSVAYSLGSPGAGRVRVVDPLPVFDGIGHIASVEVNLAP